MLQRISIGVLPMTFLWVTLVSCAPRAPRVVHPAVPVGTAIQNEDLKRLPQTIVTLHEQEAAAGEVIDSLGRQAHLWITSPYNPDPRGDGRSQIPPQPLVT